MKSKTIIPMTRGMLIKKLSGSDLNGKVLLEIEVRTPTCRMTICSELTEVINTCGGSLDEYDNRFYGTKLVGISGEVN